MDDRPLNMMIGPPTTKKMDSLTEQLTKCMAGVRINAPEWDSGKFGCLPLALEDGDLTIATPNSLTTNKRLTESAAIHPDIKDETKQADLLRLTKIQDELWTAFHIQEAATEIGVAMLVANVEDQYLVELNEQYVGYRNQTPRTVLSHLTSS